MSASLRCPHILHIVNFQRAFQLHPELQGLWVELAAGTANADWPIVFRKNVEGESRDIAKLTTCSRRRAQKSLCSSMRNVQRHSSGLLWPAELNTTHSPYNC